MIPKSISWKSPTGFNLNSTQDQLQNNLLMVAVVCSIQHLWRILSFIFSIHDYSASEKGEIYKKEPSKQQPEQLMKEAVKALNVHFNALLLFTENK